MRSYARVRQLSEEEYQELKRWERSRTMAAGKVKRAWAVLCSNQGYTYAEIAQKLEYSLVERGVEREHVGAARQFGFGLTPWSPLAAGFLSGKYSRERAGEGSAEWTQPVW